MEVCIWQPEIALQRYETESEERVDIWELPFMHLFNVSQFGVTNIVLFGYATSAKHFHSTATLNVDSTIQKAYQNIIK